MSEVNSLFGDEPVAWYRGAPIVAIIVPCYNEEEALGHTASHLLSLTNEMSVSGLIRAESYILFVDDGSKDNTWKIIHKLVRENPGRCRAIKLAVNSGHQNALLAGLEYASSRSDASITIDADLQDDTAAMVEMIQHYRSGSEVVLGVRSDRSSDSQFKKTSASIFYKLIGSMGVRVTPHHADYRLLSKVAMVNLQKFGEYHLFLRALPPLLHSEISQVFYHRAPRIAGNTKYPMRKMFALGWNGITSFSVFPLRVIGALGAFMFMASVALLLYALVAKVNGSVVPGWASITAPLYALGGMIMLSISVVGEYVGKIYIEVKRRPRYIIDKLELGDE